MPGQGGDTRPRNVPGAFLPQTRRPPSAVRMNEFQSLNKETNTYRTSTLYFILFLFLQPLFEIVSSLFFTQGKGNRNRIRNLPITSLVSSGWIQSEEHLPPEVLFLSTLWSVVEGGLL